VDRRVRRERRPAQHIDAVGARKTAGARRHAGDGLPSPVRITNRPRRGRGHRRRRRRDQGSLGRGRPP
jgi:hypothetical protein